MAEFYRVASQQLVAVPASGSGEFQFTFNNPGGHSFTVLATTNAASPVANWEVLGPPAAMGGGVYQFTDPGATNHTQRFYQLRWP